MRPLGWICQTWFRPKLNGSELNGTELNGIDPRWRNQAWKTGWLHRLPNFVAGRLTWDITWYNNG